MILRILILFIPLLFLAEANYERGPFHRSTPESTARSLLTSTTSSPKDLRSPQSVMRYAKHSDDGRGNRRVSHTVQTHSPREDKSAPVEGITSSPRIIPDPPVIRRREPAPESSPLVYLDNRYNKRPVISTESAAPKSSQSKTSYVYPVPQKPVSSSWSPKNPTVERRSDYQVASDSVLAQNDRDDANDQNKLLAESLEKEMLAHPESGLLQPTLAGGRDVRNYHYSRRSTPRPWTPPSIYTNSSAHRTNNRIQVDHRAERSAHALDEQSRDILKKDSQNNEMQPDMSTDISENNLWRFKCPSPYGYYKYGQHCGEYIECKNYVPLSFTCSAGLHFNERAEWTEYPCDHPSNVQCSQEPSPPSTRASPQAITSSPEVVTSPRPSHQTTDYMCPQQHGYFKIPGQCSEYIECKNNTPLMFVCPEGLHFDALVEWTSYPCGHPSIVQCPDSDGEITQRPTAPPPTTRPPPPPPPTTRRPPPPPTTRPPPPTTGSPPPTTTRRPTPPTTTTRRPTPPPTTRRPRPPSTTRRPRPPPTTRPPPPTTTRPPPPPTTRPAPPPTTRRPRPPPTTRRPRPPPTTRPPPPPTTRPPPPPTTRPPPPSTTRKPIPPPTTRAPMPPSTTTHAPITPSTKNPPDYNICLQAYGYFKFSDQCGEYIECKSYVPLMFTCPEGLHFNPEADWTEYPCAHPSKVQCTDISADPIVSPTTQPPVHSTISAVVTTPYPGWESTGFICPQAHGYFEHDQCSEYIECKNHVPLKYKCPGDLHFNIYVEWTDYACTHPSNVQCNKQPGTNGSMEDPNTTARPVTQRPVTQRPVTQRPVTQRPLTQKPVSTTELVVVTQSPTSERPSQELADYYCQEPNAFYSVPIQCDIYVECKDYRAILYYCPAGLLFNSKAQWPDFPCDYPSRVQCDYGHIHDPIIPVEQPTTLRPTLETHRPTVGTFRPTIGTSPAPPETHRPTVGTFRPTIGTSPAPPKTHRPTVGTFRPTIGTSPAPPKTHRPTIGTFRPTIGTSPAPPKTHRPTMGTARPTFATYPPTFPTHRPGMGTSRPTFPTHRPVTSAPNFASTKKPRYPPPTATPRPTKEIFNYSCSESDGFYSVASQCDLYVECKGGKAFEYSCPDGLHFNPGAQWPDYPCGYPSEVQCSSGDVIQKPNPTDYCPHREGFFPTDSDDCGEYMRCHAGVAVIEHCPEGLVFNFEKDTCDWPINVPECRRSRALDGYECPVPSVADDDELMIHKYRYGRSCNYFVACQEGQPRLLTCDAGLHFDEESESCVDSQLVADCDVSPITKK